MKEATENFYLELLKKQICQLKATIEKVNKHKDSFSLSAYNSILTGLIIKINVIIEQTILDFHSKEFSEVAISIYNLRQLLVHYKDSFDNSDLYDIEKTCLNIVEKFNEVYSHESEFYKSILTYDNDDEKNVVIKRSKDTYYDEESKCFVFKDNNKGIVVSKNRVTTIKDVKKGKVVAYIVNCQEPLNYYTEEDGELIYKELKTPKEIQNFFEIHTCVISKNYREHKDFIKESLNVLYGQSKLEVGSLLTHVREVKNEKAKTEPVMLPISKVLDQYFNDKVVYKEFLAKKEFDRMPVPGKYSVCIDFLRLRDNCKEDLLKTINKKDYFFIHKAISSFNELNLEILKNDAINDNQKEAMIAALLIKWVDQTIKNMSSDFINANEEFKKIHNQLIEYRNFYAHNIQQFRWYKDYTLYPFLEVAQGYVTIINSLEIEKITKHEEKREVRFVAIETEVEDFINCRYGQYIQINQNTFVGNKVSFSSKGNCKDKIVGLVPIDRDYHLRWSYYTLKDNELISRNFKRGKKAKTRMPECNNKTKVKVDVNCNDLLYIYAACNDMIEELPAREIENPNRHKSILFKASEENGYQAHAASLVDVISNYYNRQSYLPYELVKETKLDIVYNEKGKANFLLLDKKGNEIARIIDSRKVKEYELDVDNKEVLNLRKTIKGYRG